MELDDRPSNRTFTSPVFVVGLSSREVAVEPRSGSVSSWALTIPATLLLARDDDGGPGDSVAS